MNHAMLYHATTIRLQTLLAEAERERLLHAAPTSQPVQRAEPINLLHRIRNLLTPSATPVCCALQ
ncbi:MAG: hypothetical protein M3511_03230 [Deinococcota bacterium]|jgi:hypothetical protein|nr:hypothetical protein [Deinococcota bacterium]